MRNHFPRSFFYFIGNCDAIPYKAKNALCAYYRIARQRSLLLRSPRSRENVPEAHSFLCHAAGKGMENDANIDRNIQNGLDN